jgi:RimJ/RimL family protein N-acetyltransferase
MLTVRPAITSDTKFYWEHSRRHEKESGRDGNPIFSPFEKVKSSPIEDFTRSQLESWQKGLSQTGWERTWFLADDLGIYGDLELGQRPAIESALHRATLTMGIEREYRGKGFGEKLMKSAVTWARAQPQLDWLQLCVFEENSPAKTLYKKYGFIEVGSTPDMFRVFGKQISDTSMILKLK